LGTLKKSKKSRDFFQKLRPLLVLRVKSGTQKRPQKYAKPLKTQKNRFCFCSIFFKNASIHTILSSEGVE